MFIKVPDALLQVGIVAVLVGTTHSSGFAQTAAEASDLSVANVRAALSSERAAIASHPNDPANYVNLSYTLIDAGMGEQARTAAADATRVAPTRAFAFSAQGWILHHNEIGVDYGSGFDYDGALRAYRKAIELDPKDLEVRQSLANLLEFNHGGIRYAPDAELNLAIDAYRYVKQHEQVLRADVVDNLAIDLFYAGHYEDAIQELKSLPGTTEHLGIILASLAASKGSSVSIAFSNRIEGDEQRRKDALNFAAEGLWNKRLYSQATDLLVASLPDTARGAATSAKIQIFRNLQPFNASDLPPGDPRQPVQRLLEMAFTNTLNATSLDELLSRYSYPTDAAWGGALKQGDALAGSLLALMKQTDLPRIVVADLVLGRMNITAPADPGLGVPVRVQVIGVPSMQFFVVSENGAWRIAATGLHAEEVGAQALHLLETGNSTTANSLLNWYYSSLELSKAADDSLGGNLFARLWSPRSRTAAQEPLFAAAALTNDATLLRPIVSEVIEARDEAIGEGRRYDLDLLLATLYLRLQNAPKIHAITSLLLDRYPESNMVLRLAGQSYEFEHDWAAWKTLLARRLKTEPDERQLLLESATEAEAEGDYVHARQTYRLIFDGSHAVSDDYTMYAWLSLFEGKPDDKALAAVRQATMSEGNRKYRSLLTMACINAELGNTAEAHQGLLDAMSSANLTQPDAGIWYGFGRIYEQYGVVDAASSAYHRAIQIADVADGKNSTSSDLSAGRLARRRLATLNAK